LDYPAPGPLASNAARFFYFSAKAFFFSSGSTSVGYLTNMSGAFFYVGI